MKRLFSSLYDTLVYWHDQLRLRRDRRLSEGGLRPIFRVGFFCLISTIVVGLGLLWIYKSFCLVKYADSLDYANGGFHPVNVFDAAYYLLFTNGGQNLFTGGGHFWGALITTIGIFLIAYLTSALTSKSERRIQRFIDGESWYRLREHIVVFGASDYLYSIINEKTKDGSTPLFLIVTTQDVASIRREVFSFLDKKIDRNRFVFLFGDRTSAEDIAKLSLERAKEVYVIGDSKESDDIESYRDSNNMDCVVAIGDYLNSRKEGWNSSKVVPIDMEGIKGKIRQFKADKESRILPCHVMFEYQTSFAAFQFCDIPTSVKESIDFRPFNYYDLWARKVIVSGQADIYKYKYLDTLPTLTDDGKPQYISENSEQTVHLIIFGMTKMGIAMALQAAHVCHYPNFKSDDKDTNNRKRTRITFIDSDVDIEMNYFKGRFPSLMSETRTRFLDFTKKKGEGNNNNSIDSEEWCKEDYGWSGDELGWYDVEWEFIKGRIESDEVQNYVKKSTDNKKHIVTIAICLPKSHQSIASAMYLPESVYTNCLQILTFQRRSGTIVRYLAETEVQKDETARYHSIVPFGMMDIGYDSTLEEDKRAMLVSYVYDSYYSLKIAQKSDSNPTIQTEQWSAADFAFSRFKEPFKDYPTDEDTEKGIAYWEYSNYLEKWRSKLVSDKLSSAFNAITISTKLRGIGLTEDDCKNDFSEDQLRILERVEHNRWNIEKMLTGFRPLTASEAKEMKDLKEKWTENKKTWRAKRKKYKAWPTRAHIDICSVEELHQREEAHIIAFDRAQSMAIPNILKMEREEKANASD